MDLSIIIAHYDPGSHPNCLDSFHKTLTNIEAQKGNHSIEIIIADDGSASNEDVIQISTRQINESGKIIYNLTGEKLEQWKVEKGYNYTEIRHWLYLPKTEQVMSKARIGNAATSLASSDNLLFLDDDNYFISENSIEAILNLLKDYWLAFGQVQDSNGRYRPYTSNRVQGTTIAVKKEVIKNAGGFGDWTEVISSAVDSDIWWKLYWYFQKNPELKACYTSQFQTVDSCSKRWKPHIKQFFRHRSVKKEFNKIHGCPNYRNPSDNPSRIKSNWMVDLT
ncbi:glycosyltransferase family 2 protein [Candidatus Marinimicrobia bacterium PRS2]|nr:glycosyltransferase family 2 protein [Candidatus Marinimicrobia bacterium PRS2]